ncbi:MAG: hypothetical protein ACYTG2_14780 [Planctomycetota bacterium]
MTGTLSFAQGILFVSVQHLPIPWLQGTLHAHPSLVEIAVHADFSGTVYGYFDALPYGIGVNQVVLQAAFPDVLVPEGVSLSNALVATFWP